MAGAGFSASTSSGVNTYFGSGGGGGGGTVDSSQATAAASAAATTALMAACSRYTPGSAEWAKCTGQSTFLNTAGSAAAPRQVPLPTTRGGTTTAFAPIKTAAAKPIAKIKLPSYVFKPRTPQEVAAGGREFELTTGTLLVGLLLVGAAGYVIFRKK